MAVQNITLKFARTQVVKLLSVCCHAVKSIKVYLWSADIVCLPYYVNESVDGLLWKVTSCLVFYTDWLQVHQPSPTLIIFLL